MKKRLLNGILAAGLALSFAFAAVPSVLHAQETKVGEAQFVLDEGIKDAVYATFKDRILANEVIRQLTDAKATTVDNDWVTKFNAIEVIDLDYDSKTMDHKIQDLYGIQALTGLKKLMLNGHAIEDLRPLTNSKITNLELEGNLIKDIGPIGTCTNLTGLILNDNMIREIAPLGLCTELVRLQLDSNEIEELGPINFLENLKYLNIKDNRVKDLGGISKATNLVELDAAFNQIEDLGGLENLVKLEYIKVNDNQIKDLGTLEKLPLLAGLVADNNEIEDLSPLAKLTNIWWLDINTNKVTDLRPLSGLKNLTVFSVAGNMVAETMFDVLPIEYKEFLGDFYEEWLKLTLETQRELVVINKDKLAASIEFAKGFDGKEKDYTKESFDTLTKALKEAEAVYADEDATQEEVDKANDVLTVAINGLVKIAPTVDEDEEEYKPQAPDTGDASMPITYGALALSSLALAGTIAMKKRITE